MAEHRRGRALPSSSMPDLKAALVDVGGTLWPETKWPPWERLRPERVERLRAAGVEPRCVDALLAELSGRTLHSTELEYFDVWAMIDDACAAVHVQGVSAEAIRYACLLPAEGNLDPLPGAHELLECVHELGLRCVIASNGIYRTAADYWTDFRAQVLVDRILAVVSSVDTRWRKPNRGFFEVVLEAAEVPADACVMIGNSEAKDILPTASLGMRTVRVAIEEAIPTTSAADAVCASLEEAASAVRQLAQRD